MFMVNLCTAWMLLLLSGLDMCWKTTAGREFAQPGINATGCFIGLRLQ
jgi:hypothetical protein